MKTRLAVPVALLLVLAGCASTSPGGGGGIAAFDECYTDYCVGYGETGLRYLYVRTPATPVLSRRGDVRPADSQEGNTRTVDRTAIQSASLSSSAARMGTQPPPAAPPPTTVHRP